MRRATANFEATYADLTRLLLIGKCGTAVSRYMGGVLTNNVGGRRGRILSPSVADALAPQGIGSWLKLHIKAMERMHRLLTHSVFPACERLLMYLEDLASWSTWSGRCEVGDAFAS